MHYETATASLFFGHHRTVTPTPQNCHPEDEAIPILTLQQANDRANEIWGSQPDDTSPTKDETA
jgi:hypothetical protein